MTLAPALRIEHLSVAYEDRPVLENVNLELGRGKLIGIVGPNGAGKSTLLKAILGLTPKLLGSIELLGEPLRGADLRLGYVPQRESVDWDFPVTVAEVVAMGTYGRVGWFRRPSAAERARVQRALDQVGLTEFASRQISQLSGGQQQRTFLARALVQDAEVYLLDEPFSGIDATTEEALIEVLLDLRAQGRTLVAVHHDLGTVAKFFDEVVLLHRHVLAFGPPDEVLTPTLLEVAYSSKSTSRSAWGA